jgi:hypothetical protein
LCIGDIMANRIRELRSDIRELKLKIRPPIDARGLAPDTRDLRPET